MSTRAERKRQLLESVAHHEAGHALVGTLELGNFEHVTIRPTATTWGHHRSHEFWRPELFMHGAIKGPRGRYYRWVIAEQCNARIRRSVAGLVAESILNPEDAIHWSDHLMCEEDDPGADMSRALEYARARFKHHKRTKHAERLAGDLIEEQWYIVDAWLRRPVNWACIQDIAGALLKRRTLKGDVFYAILDAHPQVKMPIAEPPAWVEQEAKRMQERAAGRSK